MPVPFLLVGLGVAAGVLGAGGHLSAKETNEHAQKISQDAQKLYNNAKCALEEAKNETEEALTKLGYDKKNVLDTSMNQFLTTYDKVKHIQVKESVGIHEISKFTINQQDAIEIGEPTNIYSSFPVNSLSGVAVGTSVATIASGTAVTLGTTVSPLVAVVAPVVLFTAFSASMKADENLEKANTMYAEAEAASEKMKNSETLCEAITKRSEMFDDLLKDLNKMFVECSGLLTDVVRKREGRIFRKKLTLEDFSEKDLKLIAVTRALAGAVKAVIDTPILSKDGNISYEAENVYDQIVKELPDFGQAVQEVKPINYDLKSVATKATNTSHTSKSTTTGGTNVMSARREFTVVMGQLLRKKSQ